MGVSKFFLAPSFLSVICTPRIVHPRSIRLVAVLPTSDMSFEFLRVPNSTCCYMASCSNYVSSYFQSCGPRQREIAMLTRFGHIQVQDATVNPRKGANTSCINTTPQSYKSKQCLEPLHDHSPHGQIPKQYIAAALLHAYPTQWSCQKPLQARTPTQRTCPEARQREQLSAHSSSGNVSSYVIPGYQLSVRYMRVPTYSISPRAQY